jgi:predicted hydrocarbon binding protein
MAKILLTEDQFERLMKKILLENPESFEDLKYAHPRTGKMCKIKVAKSKVSRNDFENYGSVLVCDVYDDGQEMVVAELPVNGKSPQEVKDFICDNIERTYEILDDMLDYDEDIEINESISHRRWEIIDEPINCSSERSPRKKSWEI